MSYSLLKHTAAASTAGGSITSSAIDTSGVDLIVFGVIDYSGQLQQTPTDSQSNTWSTTVTTQTSGGSTRAKLYFCAGPTTNASHTFTYGVANSYPAIFIAAFSGSKSTSTLDQQNGTTQASGSGLQTGSVTPAEGNELVITLAGNNSSGITFSIDSPFTPTLDSITHDGATHLGGAIAYEIQSSATSRNPTWTPSSSSDLAVTIATFKAAAGGTTAVTRFLSLTGAGA